ncbi:MAG: transketolase [Deltaproteobacteria bacterium]|jgi:transketolase|nr:transketolase [Deltaproteobacteria bacterium]
MNTTKDIEELREITRKVRADILTMLNQAGSGHTGGSLSAADILTVLYFSKMKHNPKNPKWEDRDRFVLSKGHAAPALYAVLARCGYFNPEALNSLRKLGSILQGHPDMNATPGVEISTGSLGQGLSIANGMALGLKLDKKNTRVYVLMGDGEIEEGQIWEAAMSAAHYKIDNLCALLDYNGLQIDGPVKEIMNVDPLPDKWKAFGWHVFEIDGHDIEAILDAFHKAEKIKGKPSIIICNTIKGKGVSFFENKVEYHGVAPTDEELEGALKEL